MVIENLMSKQEFLEWVKNKIIVSQYFNDTIPFTDLSTGMLNKYEKQYVNVYFKGVLINMCLDLKLRSLSEGKYGLKNLIGELYKKYSFGNPFKDDELFDVITQMTYPEIRTFFKDYVEGPNPLPLKEMLELAGVKYVKSGREKVFTLGNISIEINGGKEYVKIVGTDDMNSFGKKMGYKKGDEMVSINGKKVTASKYGEIIQELFSTSKEGDELVMEVQRKDKNGNSKTVTLKAPMMKVEKDIVNHLEFEVNPTEQQLKVREGWIGKN
jgi:predicted metalloprotease with PDZ domain